MAQTRLAAFKNSICTEPSTRYGNVLTVRMDQIRTGWEQWFLLRSDAHQDNIHCVREAEEKHLNLALERNAMIFDWGDLFCAMQGRGDRRRDYDSLRPEHKRTDYLNALIETSAQRYSKYAQNWAVMARGNHETGVLKNTNFDLTSALVSSLNKEKDAAIQVGGYGGWVRFLFVMQKTRRMSLNLKYFHGAGGGGPVTRGVIDTNRQAVFLPDADMVVNGHTHDSYVLPIARERISEQGVISHDYQWFIRTPSYKDEYGDGAGGFHIERGRAPKPIGCVWGRFYYDDSVIRVDFTPMLESGTK